MEAVTEESRIEEALSRIPPDLPRDEWARIGAALKNDMGDAGFELFDAWSQRGKSYSAADTRSTWRSLSADAGITIATLFFKAIENGFDVRGSNTVVTNPAELERRRVEREQRVAESDAQREMKAKSAAGLANVVWRAAKPAGADHPYLMRKGVQPVDTLREIDTSRLSLLIGYQPKRGDDLLTGRILIAPVAVGGALSTIEMIDGDGRKSALAGGAKAGGCWAAQKLPNDAAVVLIAEGVATALSASQCSGYPAIASLSAGQLEAAARVMRERYPDAALVLLADLQKDTGEPDARAVAAARAVGGFLAVPDFGVDREPGQTDFNDLHQARGADVVRDAINAVLPTETEEESETSEALASQAKAASNEAKETDDQVIERLAALSPIQYDRARKDEAKRLGVRPATLDLMIKAARGEASDDAPEGFEDVAPWSDPVDGGALLADMARAIRRFIVCDDETVTASVLWTATTWLVESVSVCPILLINAPEKACGKTQLLTVVGRMVPRPAQAAGISSSVLFRMIEKYQPTLLVDEIETVLTKEAEDLRGILNAGHTRDSAYVWRSVAVGDDFEPRRFSVFGFKALAGINADRLAETITSRAVVAQMRRKLPHESAERLRHAESDLFDTLKSKLARWAEDNASAIRAARPILPDELGDRDQDNWEPLLAVADQVGGKWGAYARKAAIRLCGRVSDSSQSSGAELLSDIQDILVSRGLQRIASADLLGYLCEDEEKPWATWNRGKPIHARQLSKRLGEYGISSGNIKFGYGDVRKGYRLDQFQDAFSRYLASPPVLSATPLPPNADAGLTVADRKLGSATENAAATSKPLLDKAGSGVADKNAGAQKNFSETDDEVEDV